VSDIFQEVEEDVRRERYEQLWKKYGNVIIAAAVVLVLAVAGYQAWRTYDLSQRQKVSERYREASQAAESGNMVKAETDFAALSKDAPAGYATLSKLHLAGALNTASAGPPSDIDEDTICFEHFIPYSYLMR